MSSTSSFDAAASPLDERMSEYSPSLGVTGFLMLLTVFLMSNPEFGVVERLWPWQLFVKGHQSRLVNAVFALWVATSFACILLSLTAARRVRAVIVSACAAVLLVQCTGGVAGFEITDYNLNNMIPMIAVGAGMLLARESATRTLGRALAGFGAVVLVWALASGFPTVGAPSQLGQYFEEMGAALRNPGHEFHDAPYHLWWNLIPQTFMLLAAAAGMLAGLGLKHRAFLLIGAGLMLLALAFPAGVGIVLERQADGGPGEVLKQITSNFIGHGLLLWLLGVFAVVDLGLLKRGPA